MPATGRVGQGGSSKAVVVAVGIVSPLCPVDVVPFLLYSSIDVLTFLLAGFIPGSEHNALGCPPWGIAAFAPLQCVNPL